MINLSFKHRVYASTGMLLTSLAIGVFTIQYALQESNMLIIFFQLINIACSTIVLLDNVSINNDYEKIITQEKKIIKTFNSVDESYTIKIKYRDEMKIYIDGTEILIDELYIKNGSLEDYCFFQVKKGTREFMFIYKSISYKNVLFIEKNSEITHNLF